MIELQGLSRTFQVGGRPVHALRDVDLVIETGEYVAIMGPSGSGKTTLLNLVGGLDTPDAGTLSVAGAMVSSMDNATLAEWRAANVGFVFQAFNLIPVLTAVENVALPLSLAPLSKKQRKEHAEYALELVGLADRAQHRPRQLSGGQEQRVAIARAIATDPKVLLADEPTGDLDRESADQVLELLSRLNKEMQKTVLMVTHDPHAAGYAQKTVRLDKGRLVETVANPSAV